MPSLPCPQQPQLAWQLLHLVPLFLSLRCPFAHPCVSCYPRNRASHLSLGQSRLLQQPWQLCQPLRHHRLWWLEQGQNRLWANHRHSPQSCNRRLLHFASTQLLHPDQCSQLILLYYHQHLSRHLGGHFLSVGSTLRHHPRQAV